MTTWPALRNVGDGGSVWKTVELENDSERIAISPSSP